MSELQESGQMYLETILVLSGKMEHVRSIDVCKYMGFSKPSVSRAMSLLKRDEYIDINEAGYITLTQKGHDVADSIYERHTLFTKVLEMIGVPEEIAEQDACKIEHYVSEETVKAVKRAIEKYQNE